MNENRTNDLGLYAPSLIVLAYCGVGIVLEWSDTEVMSQKPFKNKVALGYLCESSQ